MPVPTLQQLIEEKDGKTVVAKIIIGGTELPRWTNCTYQFDIGQVPTAIITVPGLANLPAAVQEEAAVQIWFGYKVGVTVLTKLVFGGAIVDSVGNNGAEIIITCVMDGPRKLSYSYNRRIAFDIDNVTAVEAVTALMELAGVSNYVVNASVITGIGGWIMGEEVPYTAALGNQLQFSSYGDAINKIAEVDGSPWYAVPSGQVRVEKRDGIPSPTARRTYFTSVLTGPIETQPLGITNPLARPRITDISKNKNRRDVANFIEVDGAVIVTIGPNGEQNSDQIKETVDGISGQFPNGAYWIPTPPLFQDFNFSNELIDKPAKAFEVCERYFDLKNRLFEDISITVPGDPDVFLGETVAVKDPIYSGTGSLYFVKGYSTTIDQNSCTTQLNLIGGPESGTTGFAAPFADFTWTYDPLIIPGGGDNPINLGPNATPGAKLCEDKPADSTPPENTDSAIQGIDTAAVYIGLDGTASQDFDGFIVSYVWTWKDSLDVAHTLNGPYQTLVLAPSGSINVTLTVTDNSGRTDAITKNINTSVSLTDPPTSDPTMNDTENGGGVAAGPCTENPDPDQPSIYCVGEDCESVTPPVGQCNGLELGYLVAAGSVAMGSVDNRTWNDLTKAAAGVSGDFISVDAAVNNQAQTSSGIFGTDAGEIVKTTDNCATGSLVFTVPGGPRIECIHFDTNEMGSPTGEMPQPGTQSGDIPIYTFASPGTMTMVQAYQQCRAVGFPHSQALIAVAIMVRESGLYSKAMNTVGNTPPSTDRGICQWNDFYHPDISDACAYNTQCAITAMFRKSSGGSDFSPWNVSGPGTYLQGTNLSAVQAAVSGISDTAINPGDPSITVSPAGLKVWAGTSDGRIYVSLDSGDTWELWVEFADGSPIMQIGTPPLYGAQSASLWAFGGDTGEVSSLVRIDPATDKNFTSLFIGGDLLDAIHAAGAGDYCISSNNDTATILVFHGGGMTERVWTNPDPLGTPDGWTPCGVTGGTFNTVAGGHNGEFVIAGSDIENTTDNTTFTSVGSGPSTVNHMIWRGLPGMYALALSGGFYTTTDFGATLGAMRPNATFGTAWPGGAVGYQVAVSYGARKCVPTDSDSCTTCDDFETDLSNWTFGGSGTYELAVGPSPKTTQTLHTVEGVSFSRLPVSAGLFSSEVTLSFDVYCSNFHEANGTFTIQISPYVMSFALEWYWNHPDTWKFNGSTLGIDALIDGQWNHLSLKFNQSTGEMISFTINSTTEDMTGTFADGDHSQNEFDLVIDTFAPLPDQGGEFYFDNICICSGTSNVNWSVTEQEQSAGFSSDLDFTFTNPQDGTYLALLPVVMYQNSGGAPATPVPTGDLSWNLIDDIGTADSNGNRLLLWWAEMLASDPASINVVVPAGGADIFYRGSVAKSIGFNTISPIVQTVTDDIPVTGPTATLDLAAFASAANYGFTVGFDTGSAVTDWNAIAADPTSYDVPAFVHAGELDAVWDTSEPSPMQIIAVELAVI